MCKRQKLCFCDLPSHTLLLPFHKISSWVHLSLVMLLSERAQVSVFFSSDTQTGLFMGCCQPRQRLPLGKSRRGATTSLLGPDPMMSGLSVPSLKLSARHPSCWSGSHRDLIGCEPQLDLDWPSVSAILICIRPEDGSRFTYSMPRTLLLSSCSTLKDRPQSGNILLFSFVAEAYFLHF